MGKGHKEDTLQDKMCPHVERWVLGVLVADTVLAPVGLADLTDLSLAGVDLELDQSGRVVQHHLLQVGDI